MGLSEFQILLEYIKKYNNPTGFTYLCPIKGNKRYKVDHVDCGVDFITGLINRIDIYTTNGVKQTFNVAKDIDSWVVQKWLTEGTKV